MTMSHQKASKGKARASSTGGATEEHRDVGNTLLPPTSSAVNVSGSVLSRIATSAKELTSDALDVSRASMWDGNALSVPGSAGKGSSSRTSSAGVDGLGAESQPLWAESATQRRPEQSDTSMSNVPSLSRTGSSPADGEEHAFLNPPGPWQLHGDAPDDWLSIPLPRLSPPADYFPCPEDGAEVCALLSDPEFSPLFDIDPPIAAEDDTPGLAFTHPSQLPVPTSDHQSSLTIPSAAGISSAIASYFQNWQEVWLNYTNDVWGDGLSASLPRIEPTTDTTTSRARQEPSEDHPDGISQLSDGKGSGRDVRQSPYEAAVLRLGMMIGHLHL